MQVRGWLADPQSAMQLPHLHGASFVNHVVFMHAVTAYITIRLHEGLSGLIDEGGHQQGMASRLWAKKSVTKRVNEW